MKSARSVLWVLVFAVALTAATFVMAQTSADVDRLKSELEGELAEIEEEIAAQTKLLNVKQRETATIERDIDVLSYQISRARLNIRAKAIEITRIGGVITTKIDKILDLEARMARERESLSELLRKTREIEDVSLVEIILGNDDISAFFADIDSFEFVQIAIHKSFSELRSTRSETEGEKKVLEYRQSDEIDAKKIVEGEKRTIERKEDTKQGLLVVSKDAEQTYKDVLAIQEKERVRIRSALFKLRGSDAISFGEALDHANFISAKTGVRPAFLLAIITQESNLGANVGTCNRPEDPPNKHWESIMKPSRDKEPFLAVTTALGLDPDVVPLSCPAPGGYGGAMGPAQFIPSTWVLYDGRVSNVTGNRPANPWTPRDAFTASALFLKDLGAAAGGYTAERTAALRYYAGGRWNLARNAFYGNDVMAIASGYQEQIDILQGR